jgi:hypothetical protein
MRRSLATQALSVMLIVLLPGIVLFADAGALMHSSGGVNVDGKSAPSSLALFAGDKVSTAAHGVATITAAGSILTLSPGTSLTYGTNTVQMECGLLVSPASEDTTYSISHGSGKLMIEVRAGSALVDDGQQKMTLVAGKEMSLPSPESCADPVDAKQEPPARGFHMSKRNIGLLAGAGAGALAAGVVIAEHGNKHCISPDGSPACKCSNTNPNKCQ